MNLKKFSQQSYFKYKIEKQQRSEIIKEENEEEIKLSQNDLHKQCKTQISASPQTKSSTSQFFQKFKSFTTSTSPLQKYQIKQKDLNNTISQFTIENKQIQSSSEQKEVIDRLLRWGKKREDKIKENQDKKKIEELKQVCEKPKLSKETLRIYEQGLKHHLELNSFIKFKQQSTQRSNDYPPLQKLEKLKKGSKIIIEYEEEIEDKPDDINDKTTQYKLSNKVESESIESSNRQSRSKSDYTSPPIHLRYEYEIKLKNAKLKQLIDEKEKAFQQELELAKKYNTTAEQFEHFLSEQDNFQKKKQQFQDANLKKELEKIQELESQFSYKPEINFPPQHLRTSKSKEQDEKFNDKLKSFKARQQKSKNIYFFKSTLPDYRKNINKKYHEILNKSEDLVVSQIQFQTEN